MGSLRVCLTIFWVRLGVEAYLMRSMFTSEGAIATVAERSLGFPGWPVGHPGKPKRARRGVAVVIIRTLGCMQTRVVISGVRSMLWGLYGCV